MLGVGFPAAARAAAQSLATAPADAAAAAVQAPEGPRDEHPTLRLGKWLRVSGKVRLQIDGEESEVRGDDEPIDGLDVARRRVGVEGAIGDLVEFEVDRELRRDHPWRDVYVNYAQFRAVQVQGGQFKLPFGLDENASSTRLDFVHRALASTILAPGRDRGVMVHGRVARRVIRYEAGLFDHDGRNARTDNPARTFGGRTVVFRLRASPFAPARRPLSRIFDDFHVGVAAARSEVPEGLPALRGRTVLEAPFFRSRYDANGVRQRTGVELRWRSGPVGVDAEYMRVTTERRGEGVDDGDLSPLLATGWYLGGTWAVTGERKARGLDRPRRPFARGGLGAVEAAVRIEAVRFGSTGTGEEPSLSPRAEVVRGNRDRAITFGLNWYLNRWIKVQANVVREQVDDPALGPADDRVAFWSRLIRLQVTL